MGVWLAVGIALGAAIGASFRYPSIVVFVDVAGKGRWERG